MENIDVSSFSCLPPCSGLFVTSFNKFNTEKTLQEVFPHKKAYNDYKKITPYLYTYSSGKNAFFSFLSNILWYLTFKYVIENGKTIWDMWEYSSTPQQSTRSLRTEQQSLWTCYQQLEAPWDCSLDSPSSVQWRFYTL